MPSPSWQTKWVPVASSVLRNISIPCLGDTKPLDRSAHFRESGGLYLPRALGEFVFRPVVEDLFYTSQEQREVLMEKIDLQAGRHPLV